MRINLRPKRFGDNRRPDTRPGPANQSRVSRSVLLSRRLLWPYLVNTASVAAFKGAIKARRKSERGEPAMAAGSGQRAGGGRCRDPGSGIGLLRCEMLNARAHITTTRGQWLLHLHSRREPQSWEPRFARLGIASGEGVTRWRGAVRDSSSTSRSQPGKGDSLSAGGVGSAGALGGECFWGRS